MGDLDEISQELGYNVVFDSLGGSSVASALALPYDSSVPEPDEPEREGFLFARWYRDEDLTEDWDFELDTVTEDVVLYAAWAIDPSYYCAVSFVVEGMDTQTITLRYGEELGIDSLDGMFTYAHASVAWEASELALLEGTITENLVIHGTLVPDADGSALSLGFTGLEADAAAFQITSGLELDYTASVFVAVYDGGGKMTGVLTTEVLALSGQETSFEVDLSGFGNWAAAKAFLLSPGFAPACNATVVEKSALP